MHAAEAWPLGDMARVIADMLEQVGFTVDLRILDVTTWRTDIYLPGKGQEINLMELGGQMNPFFATRQFHSRHAGFDHPTTLGPDRDLDPDWDAQTARIDELLDFAWTEVLDDEARIAAYHEACTIAAEVRALYFGLLQKSTLYAISDRIEYEPRFDIDIWGYDMKLVK